jgi:hypothetical protein
VAVDSNGSRLQGDALALQEPNPDEITDGALYSVALVDLTG